MSDTINKIKNHPGFMPFGCVNVNSNDEDTQSKRDAESSKKEQELDAEKGK